MLADHDTEDWEELWRVRGDGRAEVLAVTVERWTGGTGTPTN
jgi:hypothetical protein